MGLGAALLEEHQELDPAEARAAAQEGPQGEHGVAHEPEQVPHRREQAQRLLADPDEEGFADGRPARPLALRHGGGEVHQPSHPVGQPVLVHHELALRPEGQEVEQDGDKAAVPAGQVRGLKRQALGARGRLEGLRHAGERGDLVRQPPAAGELHPQRIRRRATAA